MSKDYDLVKKIKTKYLKNDLRTRTMVVACLEISLIIILISLSAISINNLQKDENYPEIPQDQLRPLINVFISLIVASCIQMGLAGLLFYAAYKDKRRMLKPWTLSSLFTLLLTPCVMIITVSFCNTRNIGGETGIIVFTIVGSILKICFMQTVSAYNELRKRIAENEAHTRPV